MDENKQNNTNNPKEEKEPKKVNSAAKNQKPGFGELVADHKAEFKKIVWPNKKDVIKKNRYGYCYFNFYWCCCILHGYCFFTVTGFAY